MPSTGRWALRYPALSDAPNGPQQVQALADDTDDRLGGMIPVLSSARPPHKDGRMIRETDTGDVLVSNGTAWILLRPGTFPAWQYSGGNGQAIPNNADTQYAPTIVVEAAGVTGSAVNVPAQVTITRAGRYTLGSSLRFTAGAATGERTCFVRIARGGTLFRIPGSVFESSSGRAVQAAGDRRLQVGDVVSAWVFQNSGGSLNIDDVRIGNEAFFTGTWLCP